MPRTSSCLSSFCEQRFWVYYWSDDGRRLESGSYFSGTFLSLLATYTQVFSGGRKCACWRSLCHTNRWRGEAIRHIDVRKWWRHNFYVWRMRTKVQFGCFCEACFQNYIITTNSLIKKPRCRVQLLSPSTWYILVKTVLKTHLSFMRYLGKRKSDKVVAPALIVNQFANLKVCAYIGTYLMLTHEKWWQLLQPFYEIYRILCAWQGNLASPSTIFTSHGLEFQLISLFLTAKWGKRLEVHSPKRQLRCCKKLFLKIHVITFVDITDKCVGFI